MLAAPEHNTPTIKAELDSTIKDPLSRIQVEALQRNCKTHGIDLLDIGDLRRGIVHVMAPELGAVMPGMTVVCGDSHTSTHGALGALAFGIGTSEVKHVMATQCLWQKKAKNMQVVIEGQLAQGVSAKDIVLAVIGKIGTAGGTGHTIEFAGSTIRALPISGRMTICNMAVEAGARAGLIGVDETTIRYIESRPLFAQHAEQLEAARAHWHTLHSDPGAFFDRTIEMRAESIQPQVTWGTSPEMVCSIEDCIPDPDKMQGANQSESARRALAYMGLSGGEKISDITLDKIFIGSCTNSRLEDLIEAATVVKGSSVHPSIKQAIIVPGSGTVKLQAEQMGLDKIFTDAGFEWRETGCSMCLAMNADRLEPGERCASTSNRNFEGRQGFGGRTHLVSPTMAAAAALAGRFVDVRSFFK